MRKIFVTTILASALTASAAFAEMHAQPGNSGLAGSMADALSDKGFATLGREGDFADKNNNGRGTASSVSGKTDGGTGNGGWGNVGSTLSGGQVSNRGGTRGSE